MIRTWTLFTLLSLAPLPAAHSLRAPQDGDGQGETQEIVDKRERIADLLGELSDHVNKKGDEDEAAIATIEALTAEFPRSGPKDRAAIVKRVGNLLKIKRKPLEKDVPNDALHMAAVVALEQMAPESCKRLIAAIGDKAFRDNPSMQVQIALSVGKTKSPDAVKPLLKLLDHPIAEVQAAGATALGQYWEADEKLRKDLFEELLKTILAQQSAIYADTEGTDLEARERWSIILPAITGSLQALSGHDETDPNAWRDWWNEHKKEEWKREAE